ncbi:hypothetical protein Tco_1248996, partial [Tanacetum coccineum]
MSCLVEADLDYKYMGYYETKREEEEEEMLKGFMLSLGHVKELKIEISCIRVLYRLKAKGLNVPSCLKYPDVPSSYSFDSSSMSGDSVSVENSGVSNDSGESSASNDSIGVRSDSGDNISLRSDS